MIQTYSLDSLQLEFDFYGELNKEHLMSNQKIIEDLEIYSVPTIIIDNDIIPGYISSDELTQIINYKLFN